MTMPQPASMTPAAVGRRLRHGAIATLPAGQLVGVPLVDLMGNVWEWAEYDGAETTLTKRIGDPVGTVTADTTEVTADKSASTGEYRGWLSAVPTVALPYVLINRHTASAAAVNAVLGVTVTLYTDGTVQKGDRLAWLDDQKFTSNEDVLGFGATIDAGIADAADSTTSLTSFHGGVAAHVNMLHNLIEWKLRTSEVGSTQITVGGDTNYVNTVLAGGNGLHTLQPDTTGHDANDEVYLSSVAAFAKFITGKRGSMQGYIKNTEGATNKLAMAFGLSTAMSNLMTDTTGIAALASVWKGAIFYKSTSTLVWGFATSDGTTLNTGVLESLGTASSATEYHVRFCWEDDGTTITCTMYINGSVVGTRRTVPIAAAGNMYPCVSLKNVQGTTDEKAELRGVRLLMAA